MTTGRCLCGAIHYEFPANPRLSCIAIATVVAVRLVRRCRPSSSCRRPRCASPAGSRKSSHRRRRVAQLLRRVRLADLLPRRNKRPDVIDLYAGTLDDASALAPQCHVHAAEQLPWFEVLDDLPRYPGSRWATADAPGAAPLAL